MNTSEFLAPTQKLFEALDIFQVSPALQPDKKHWGAHVKLLDFHFNRKHLVDRLVGTLIDWVYCKKESQRIFQEEYGTECDLSAASANLYQSAKETFRAAAPQGQFGELLLSGFLQHLFHAAPLLRKQKVRTSDNHERFGADAIHYSNEGGKNLYLGESKCYKSSYQFPAAFATSLESMNTTLAKFSSEIKKFHSANFIEEELRPVASALLKNQLTDLEIHPVIIIIYNETQKLTPGKSDEIKAEILQAIYNQCLKITPSAYATSELTALSKYIYIIMPVWELDQLLNEFVQAL